MTKLTDTEIVAIATKCVSLEHQIETLAELLRILTRIINDRVDILDLPSHQTEAVFRSREYLQSAKVKLENADRIAKGG